MSKIDAEGRVVTNKKSELDETIEWARDLAYGDIFDDIGWHEAQRYEKVANWLEDYKDYRNANFDLSQVADNRYIEGYTQGIEDFVKQMEEDYVFNSIARDDINAYEYSQRIKVIAEQLKERWF